MDAYLVKRKRVFSLTLWFFSKQSTCLSAVILSDYYDLPFSDILDWNSFSVIIKEDDVPNLKKILNGIPEEKYQKMRKNVLQVDGTFLSSFWQIL